MWHPYSYLWNEDQQDAVLVDSAGTDHDINYETPTSTNQLKPLSQTWHVSAENECRLCHNAGSGFVLGFSVNQLNRSIRKRLQKPYHIDQLTTLAASGVLTKTPSIPDSIRDDSLILMTRSKA